MNILILTSSFEKNPNALLNNRTLVFSANWGILHNIPIDYYFCSTDEPLLISQIIKSNKLIKTWVITKNIKDKLNIAHDQNTIPLFEFLQNCGPLGKIHMHPKKIRKNLDLPTTGVQMIYSMLKYMPSKLIIRGINLYSNKNSNGGYKIYGNTFLENPYIMQNKPHSLKTDLSFIYEAFTGLLKNGTIIDSDSEVIIEILNNIKNNISLTDCYATILKKYYL